MYQLILESIGKHNTFVQKSKTIHISGTSDFAIMNVLIWL